MAEPLRPTWAPYCCRMGFRLVMSSGLPPWPEPLENTGWWPTTIFQGAVLSAKFASSSFSSDCHDCWLMPPAASRITALKQLSCALRLRF